jgi:hypothetical protein
MPRALGACESVIYGRVVSIIAAGENSNLESPVHLFDWKALST